MLTQEQLTMMAENVARIRENMAAAAREAGRDPADILLCAACKTRTVEEVIASAGQKSRTVSISRKRFTA